MAKTLFHEIHGLKSHESFQLCLNEGFKEVRDLIDEMYNEVESFIGDPHFNNLFQQEFHGPFWQLYVTWVFLKYGYSKLVKPKSLGPDIVLEDGTIIEAINVSSGTAENKPTSAFDNNEYIGGVSEIPDRKTLLRITSGIDTKRKQYAKWITGGIVSEKQPFLIALNAGTVGYDAYSASGASYGEMAVFAMGQPYFEMVRNPVTNLPDPDNIRQAIQYNPRMSTPKGGVVELDLFLSNKADEVSGILFSPNNFIAIAKNVEEMSLGIQCIENGFSKNPISKNFLEGSQRSRVRIDEGIGYQLIRMTETAPIPVRISRSG